jgi:hypothetical protein
VRRALLAPLVLLLSLGLVVTAPLWMLITVTLSPFTAGRLRPSRLLWLVTVYLLVEWVTRGILLITRHRRHQAQA